MMKTKLNFRNGTARRQHELVVDNEKNANEVIEWYDAFYASDDYTVKKTPVQDNSEEIQRILSEQFETAGEAQSKLDRIATLL